MSNARTSVFISYSHADSQWLRLLNTHLKPLIRDQKLQIWSDQKIRKGERWRDRIHKQMAMARVGIFLVSADFLASDFINAEELPPLLKAADREGATLLIVIVRPCAGAFQDSPLSQLQAMNGPQTPLSGMSKNQREQVMASVYDELRGIFRTPATKPRATPAATAKIASTKLKAALKTPKIVSALPATSTAGEAAAKTIAKRKAIAAAKAKAAAKLAAKKAPSPTRKAAATKPAPNKNPTARKPAAKPTTPKK